jgi:peptidoglycan lytic transglycosylase
MPALRTLRPATPFALAIALLLCGCHKQRVKTTSPLDTGTARASLSSEERVGYASWYGDPYHGRRTSNGETYNKYSLTAAHRTLPFDTVVRVENLDNGRNIKVRINDRGPFIDNRIIDLSYAAAKEINMIGPGTAKVRLEVLQAVPNPFPLAIQVGSFKDWHNAENARKNLEEHYQPVLLRKFTSSQGEYFRVLVGQYSNFELARRTLQDLKSLHYDGLIVRLDP